MTPARRPHDPREAALLEACRAAPDDDLPRLVYADWLDEGGQSDKANYIRLEIEQAGLPTRYPRKAELQVAAGVILRECKHLWDAPLLRALHAPAVIHYERGLPAEIACRPAVFLAGGDAVRRHAPTATALRLPNCDDDSVRALADCPHLSDVRHLNLASGEIGPAGAEALAASPHAGELQTLDLSDNRMGAAGIQALIRSGNPPLLGRLSRLDVSHNDIGDAAVLALARSPLTAGLRSLNLGFGSYSRSSLMALARSPHLNPDLHLAVEEHVGTLAEFRHRLEQSHPSGRSTPGRAR